MTDGIGDRVNRKIVVVGSINMDIVISASRLPKMGETILGERVTYLPGGKGANQAVAMARLGGDVQMVGAVGNDEFGRSLLEQLKANGVGTTFVEMIDGVQTGIANIYSVERDNCITVVPGANFAVTPEKIDGRIEQAIASADVLVTQLEIPLATVAHVLKVAKQHGVTTILNPAPAQNLPVELLELVDFLTPNETEFEAMSGHSFSSREQLQALMEEWQNKHKQTLLVTLGEEGCAYLDNGMLNIVPPPRVDVVDTTGAGDSFNGALAVGVTNGWPMSEMVSFAVNVSAKAVTKFGAQEGMPFLNELKE
ncbi:ribokinase [Sporosarcina sp. NCCP-2222]|uniref:ribokinase n=1 Tax=Sporosarcina sp. NCCP-2222 TaxID=2935073 RepID=UPI00207E0BDB|nr:ribokinase [Sporosarcina sp. NCCP-2222]GKV57230.1 ribokinase [Sporosarcina sp. NCCP-2222]